MYSHPAEILLVEDDPGDVDLTIEILKRGNIEHHLSIVDDGVKAIEFLQRKNGHANAPRPDLIILDLNLPNKDGRAVLAEIKTHCEWKSIPVVIFTTSNAETDISKSYFSGANCYIAKPTEFSKFSSVVESLKNFWFSTSSLPIEAILPKLHSMSPKENPLSDQANVLLIENDSNDADYLKRVLAKEKNYKFSIYEEDNLHGAIDRIINGGVDVILLDLGLDETQGLETFDRLFPHAFNIPIVIMTGNPDQKLAHDLIRKGAQDFIVKNVSESSTYSKTIRYAIERKQTEISMARMTFYDPLTDLPNRSLFWDRLNHLVVQSLRHNQNFALLFLDLDHFKQINDTLGHTTGDKLLKMVSKRLFDSIRSTDSLSRIGGDEFSVVIPNSGNDLIAIQKIASKIHKSLLEPFVIDQQEIFITASSGISVYPLHGNDSETLLKHADAAVFNAKKEGRNRYNVYAEIHEKNSVQRFNIHGDLARAVRKREFELYYQPRLSLSSGKITGAEALIRWNHPKLGLVSPAEFIPVAEEQGSIIEIGKWILQNVTTQMTQWRDKNLLNGFTVSINVSSRQFRENSLKRNIAKILNATGLDPKSIELELTESQLFEDLKLLAKMIIELNDMGLKVVMDDFGTGYAGMGYMKELPLHAIKIDKSYIQKITDRREEQKIVRGIIELAHDIGIKVVAEGVETREQLEILEKFQCDEIQGYLISKPVNVEQFTQRFLQYPYLKFEKLPNIQNKNNIKLKSIIY